MGMVKVQDIQGMQQASVQFSKQFSDVKYKFWNIMCYYLLVEFSTEYFLSKLKLNHISDIYVMTNWILSLWGRTFLIKPKYLSFFVFFRPKAPLGNLYIKVWRKDPFKKWRKSQKSPIQKGFISTSPSYPFFRNLYPTRLLLLSFWKLWEVLSWKRFSKFLRKEGKWLWKPI